MAHTITVSGATGSIPALHVYSEVLGPAGDGLKGRRDRPAVWRRRERHHRAGIVDPLIGGYCGALLAAEPRAETLRVMWGRPGKLEGVSYPCPRLIREWSEQPMLHRAPSRTDGGRANAGGATPGLITMMFLIKIII